MTLIIQIIEVQRKEKQMQEQKNQSELQMKSMSSLKVLNQQMEQVLQIKHEILNKQEQDKIIKIIQHAKTCHNVREYINSRYTNKLSYMLDKFVISAETSSKIADEIQRVKLLVSAILSDTSAFINMETNLLRI